jgi:hypothetical protein
LQRTNVVFFAANSFVQQERNFVVPHVVSAFNDGGMSTVVVPDAPETLPTDCVPPTAASPTSARHRTTFAASTSWRVRGLGFVNVTTVSEW